MNRGGAVSFGMRGARELFTRWVVRRSSPFCLELVVQPGKAVCGGDHDRCRVCCQLARRGACHDSLSSKFAVSCEENNTTVREYLLYSLSTYPLSLCMPTGGVFREIQPTLEESTIATIGKPQKGLDRRICLKVYCRV